MGVDPPVLGESSLSKGVVGDTYIIMRNRSKKKVSGRGHRTVERGLGNSPCTRCTDFPDDN